ncbi:MAG TPA: hypothetical protein VF384_20165 [Planctomycetota bacterium]
MAVSRAARFSLVLIAGAPLAAQWIPVPALNAPPSRSGFTLTALPNGELLLFGGDVANPAATEWSWDGIRWAQVTTPVPRRQLHAMAVDESTGNLVLFGGTGQSGPLTDTWTFDGTAWTQVMTLTSPPSLAQPSMAFDPATSTMILGGSNAGVFETWRFALGDWTQVSALAPPGAVAIYHDSVRRELALFAFAPGLTTWRLSNGAWVQTGADASLAAAAFLSTFDRDRGRLVLMAPGVPNGTYEWDGLSGSSLAGATPPASPSPAIAFHPARSEAIHVVTTGPLAVWRWAPDPVPLAAAHGTPCVSPQFQLGLVPGDSPQPGASHRLQVQGPNGTSWTFALLGFSHTTYLGMPLPTPFLLGPANCQMRVEPAILSFLGTGLPAQLLLTLPNASVLLGQRYDAQGVQFDGTGVLDSTNGLEVQVGLPLAANPLVETFNSPSNRDPLASGDAWVGGNVSPVALGGDGRHGSFDHTHGTLNPAGEFEFDNDNFVVTAERSLTGLAYVITDGKYSFTDFVVPAGVTVRFVGSVPAQIFVRGQTDIRGTIDVSGAEMPFWVPTIPPAAGQHVSTFNSRGTTPPGSFVNGQPGGAPGCGGGRGGDGANECRSTGPDIVPGLPPPYDGKVGQDVRVSAGHAYAASSVGTGGRGGVLHPASGLTVNTPLVGALYRPHFSQGGSGGGFSGPGGQSSGTALIGVQLSLTVGPSAAFPLMPFPPVAPPPGYTSLDHFLVGGSGGGGGGSAPFGTIGLTSVATVPPNVYQAGHGGTGGGGAVAVRSGGALTVSSTATLRSKGGAGVVVNGDSHLTPAVPDLNNGISSPGGGGSGGSFLLQSSDTVSFLGTVDTAGGAGSRTAFITPSVLNQVSQAGSGAPGFYRLEAAGAVAFAGTGTPAYVAADNSGPLTDRDDRSGSRSLWMLPPTSDLPVWLRYELVADVAGSPVLFSDDAAVSPLRADDPTGAVVLRIQGARLDPLTSLVVPSTIGPWRTSLVPGGESSVNRDRAKVIRFDLVLNKNLGPVSVRELRLFWR